MVTVISTLDNSPTDTCSSTFSVEVFDPCQLASINAFCDSVENLVAFAGYTTQSQSKYTFKDSVSL